MLSTGGEVMVKTHKKAPWNVGEIYMHMYDSNLICNNVIKLGTGCYHGHNEVPGPDYTHKYWGMFPLAEFQWTGVYQASKGRKAWKRKACLG